MGPSQHSTEVHSVKHFTEILIKYLLNMAFYHFTFFGTLPLSYYDSATTCNSRARPIGFHPMKKSQLSSSYPPAEWHWSLCLSSNQPEEEDKNKSSFFISYLVDQSSLFINRFGSKSFFINLWRSNPSESFFISLLGPNACPSSNCRFISR